MTLYDPDLDAVAATALSIVCDVLDIDPAKTLATLTALCQDEPGRMAQVLMALAVWVGADVTIDTLNARAEAAAVGRIAAMTRAAA